ncbi:MAG: DUF2059 domain-containing protein [Rickettsiales bacterium]
MKFLTTLICFFLTVATISQPASAITAEKQKDIQELFKAMGMTSIVKDIADMSVSFVINQEKKSHPDMSKQLEQEISKAVYDITMATSGDFENTAATVYDKYYTQDEIKQLTIFFSSPIGRKYSSVLNPMMQDLGAAAEAVSKKNKTGAKQAKAVEEILEKYGYK